MLLNQDVPWRAAKTLQAGIDDGTVPGESKNLALLATALRSAQETQRAIVHLTRAAEKDASGDGDLYARLSALHLSNGGFDHSVETAQKALRLKLKRPEDLWMTVGVSHFEMSRYEQARKAFRRMSSATDNRRQKKIAADWIRYVDAEETKQRELDRGLAAR